VWQFIDERKAQIAFNAFQHVSLVVQAVLVAIVLAVALAVLVTQVPKLEPAANAFSAIGLTIPSFALLGLMLPLVGIGWKPAFIALTFYASLPILRNAVVGLQGVDKTLLESARGLGMSNLASLVRVSTQMTMGIAAIAAYVLGPGLGVYIFTGLAQIGGANALNSALVGTLGIVVLALVLDALLKLLGRLTTSEGIRV
jgi:osmoprotectant transport system permease protein